MRQTHYKISEIVSDIPLLKLSGAHTVEDTLELMQGYNRQAVNVEMWEWLVGIFTYADFEHKARKMGRGKKHIYLFH